MTQTVHTDTATHSASGILSSIPVQKRPRRKKRKYDNVDMVPEPYNHVSGEVSLWVAVITQAMMDALSKAGNAEALYHKHEAIAWLTGNSKDFFEVCSFANMDPGYVRRKAKRALIFPASWRASPGKGKRYAERRLYRQRIKKLSAKKEDPAPVVTHIISGPWAHTVSE